MYTDQQFIKIQSTHLLNIPQEVNIAGKDINILYAMLNTNGNGKTSHAEANLVVSLCGPRYNLGL